MMGPNDVVRLKNVGKEKWFGRYNNQPYTIFPGGEGIAPFIAICNWFGHPDAVDTDPRNRHRFNELERLRVKYGVYDDDTKWDANTPKIEVFTLDGERVLTVLDDPEGNHLHPSTTTMAEKTILEEQLDAMQKQMRVMQAQLDVQNRADEAEAQAGPVGEDDAPVTSPPHEAFIPPVAVPPEPAAVVSEDTPSRVRVGTRRAEGG